MKNCSEFVQNQNYLRSELKANTKKFQSQRLNQKNQILLKSSQMERKLQLLTEKFESTFAFDSKIMGGQKSKIIQGMKFAARKNFFEIKESVGEMIKRAGRSEVSAKSNFLIYLLYCGEFFFLKKDLSQF